MSDNFLPKSTGLKSKALRGIDGPTVDNQTCSRSSFTKLVWPKNKAANFSTQVYQGGEIMRQIAIVLATLIAMMLNAHSANAQASVDCNNGDITSVMICKKNSALRSLDRANFELFKSLSSSDKRNLYKIGRNSFVAERKACGDRASCIVLAYNKDTANLVISAGGTTKLADQEGYWFVALSSANLPMRKQRSSSTEVFHLIEAATPIEVLNHADGDWVLVKVVGTKLAGWVRTNSAEQKELFFQKIDPTDENPYLVVPSTLVEPSTKEVSLEKTVSTDGNVAKSTYDEAISRLQIAEEKVVQLQASLDNAALSAGKQSSEENAVSATTQLTVSKADYEALQKQLDAANQALADQMAKVGEDFVAKSDYDKKVQQLDTLTGVITDLKASISGSYVEKTELERVQAQFQSAVPKADYETLQKQLNASNQALTDQMAKVGADFVAKSDYDEKAKQLDTLNTMLGDLKASISSEYVPRTDFEKVQAELKVVVPKADYEALQKQLNAANQALTDQIAKVGADFVAKSDYDEKAKQLDTLNTMLADLKASIGTDYVEKAEFEKVQAELQGVVAKTDYVALQKQLDAANQALAEQMAKIASDYVAKTDYEEKSKQLDTLNTMLSDLKGSLEANYVEKATYDQDVLALQQKVDALNQTLTEQKSADDAERESQVSALNSTIVDVQHRVDTLKRRQSELQTAYANLVAECKANPECADVMQFEQ